MAITTRRKMKILEKADFEYLFVFMINKTQLISEIMELRQTSISFSHANK